MISLDDAAERLADVRRELESRCKLVGVKTLPELYGTAPEAFKLVQDELVPGTTGDQLYKIVTRKDPQEAAQAFLSVWRPPAAQAPTAASVPIHPTSVHKNVPTWQKKWTLPLTEDLMAHLPPTAFGDLVLLSGRAGTPGYPLYRIDAEDGSLSHLGSMSDDPHCQPVCLSADFAVHTMNESTVCLRADGSLIADDLPLHRYKLPHALRGLVTAQGVAVGYDPDCNVWRIDTAGMMKIGGLPYAQFYPFHPPYRLAYRDGTIVASGDHGVHVSTNNQPFVQLALPNGMPPSVDLTATLLPNGNVFVAHRDHMALYTGSTWFLEGRFPPFASSAGLLITKLGNAIYASQTKLVKVNTHSPVGQNAQVPSLAWDDPVELGGPIRSIALGQDGLVYASVQHRLERVNVQTGERLDPIDLGTEVNRLYSNDQRLFAVSCGTHRDDPWYLHCFGA